MISRALQRAASSGSVSTCSSELAILTAKSRARAHVGTPALGQTDGREHPITGLRNAIRADICPRCPPGIGSALAAHDRCEENTRPDHLTNCPFSRGITCCLTSSSAHIRKMAQELAKQAWFLRVQTTEAKPAVIDFAVGKATLQEAIAAVLHRPELDLGDQVTLTSQLTAIEISSFRLRPDGVRTYGRRLYNSAAGRGQ
jgi:hypothetical protein